MEKFSVSYDVAAAHVQERRYCVHLNEGFVVQCKVSALPHGQRAGWYSNLARS